MEQKDLPRAEKDTECGYCHKIIKKGELICASSKSDPKGVHHPNHPCQNGSVEHMQSQKIVPKSGHTKLYGNPALKSGAKMPPQP